MQVIANGTDYFKEYKNDIISIFKGLDIQKKYLLSMVTIS